MSRNCCNPESYCCNTNCCNNCDSYNNGALGCFNGSCLYILAILLLFFGGGFGPCSFWSNYGNIFRCSGFNNGWCNNIGSNKFNNGIFNNGNFTIGNLANFNN